MIQFYAPDITETGTLPEQESTHCCRVLRKQQEDIIQVTDGKGTLYECEILEAHAKHTTIEILKATKVSPWWGFRLEVCIAPSKNIDRIEWFVEKAVEIGIDRIVLMKCARSERKIAKTERLKKIAISAMNQSLKATLPEITEITDFKTLIADGFEGQKYMGYCDDRIPLLKFTDDYKGGNVRIMIGPEGDFSPEEVTTAMAAGYKAVTFGGSRLRLETAALYCTVAAHVAGDNPCTSDIPLCKN